MARRFPPLLAAVALSLAFPVSGCAALVSDAPVAGATLADEKALLVAEAAYNGVGHALETALDAGLIEGAAAEKAASAENLAWDALTAARAAKRAGDAEGLRARVQATFEAIAAAQAALNEAGIGSGDPL